MKTFSRVVASVLIVTAGVPDSAHAQLGAARRAAQRVANTGTRRQLPDDGGNVPAQYQGTPTAPPAPGSPAAPAAPPKPVDAAKAAAEKDAATQRLVTFQKEQAEKGRPSAQYSLGLRYLNGDGVSPDAKLGREWLEKAAKQGDSDAIKKLKELDAAAAKSSDKK